MDVSRGHLCVSVRRGHRLQMFHVVSCDGLFSSFLRRSLFTSSSASARSDRLFSHLASCFVFFVPHFCVGCWALCIGVAVACAATDGDPATLEIILSRVSARVRGTVAPPPWCSVCGVSTESAGCKPRCSLYAFPSIVALSVRALSLSVGPPTPRLARSERFPDEGFYRSWRRLCMRRFAYSLIRFVCCYC